MNFKLKKKNAYSSDHSHNLAYIRINIDTIIIIREWVMKTDLRNSMSSRKVKIRKFSLFFPHPKFLHTY